MVTGRGKGFCAEFGMGLLKSFMIGTEMGATVAWSLGQGSPDPQYWIPSMGLLKAWMWFSVRASWEFRKESLEGYSERYHSLNITK